MALTVGPARQRARPQQKRDPLGASPTSARPNEQHILGTAVLARSVGRPGRLSYAPRRTPRRATPGAQEGTGHPARGPPRPHRGATTAEAIVIAAHPARRRGATMRRLTSVCCSRARRRLADRSSPSHIGEDIGRWARPRAGAPAAETQVVMPTRRTSDQPPHLASSGAFVFRVR